ncbi:MAG: GxxExxY protein [Ignavibacteria bacterium GWA2_55_11]|nr:MAG: GxxExxY protein [Ignavibacteria bacterium GWA2_55_11]OGU45073.1 MAG: GxxExxY protein [Ignavibacteria bacterium GWC2_56_12]OGU64767.1 MAG: GxxExxY protein [Ignavibacteria bacterium RIFCSPHIGHO2_02_FULL_56_12]OGU72525.1 MAG: GxxExxY protein [Ignavibacteria bacterium RIFCSPLOWO2_02_FULL_55_14]OGU74532.1 MAG: GxxExxY protein [Ignavibacteria bacterium RIFCSPLOWO2_12_FULL_56_21]HAV22573.1 GxxExxY protein [Bacteroidota bacterium]
MPTHESSYTVLGAAIEVHKALGPGLLESAYESCLYRELQLRGIQVVRQVPLPIVYKDVHLDCGYRMDLVIDDNLVVEVKSVDALAPIHEAQILTYLRFARLPLGLLINFNVLRLKEGIRRFIL